MERKFESYSVNFKSDSVTHELVTLLSCRAQAIGGLCFCPLWHLARLGSDGYESKPKHEAKLAYSSSKRLKKRLRARAYLV